MKRTLRRVVAGGYRDQIAARCFSHASGHGDTSLVLYDVATLHFEAETEDDLRKVGYSKQRRVDPQILVGLLVDRRGFSLDLSWLSGLSALPTPGPDVVEDVLLVGLDGGREGLGGRR